MDKKISHFKVSTYMLQFYLYVSWKKNIKEFFGLMILCVVQPYVYVQKNIHFTKIKNKKNYDLFSTFIRIIFIYVYGLVKTRRRNITMFLQFDNNVNCLLKKNVYHSLNGFCNSRTCILFTVCWVLLAILRFELISKQTATRYLLLFTWCSSTPLQWQIIVKKTSMG